MSLAKCYSGALNGVDARTVEIEVFATIGTSSFAIVGLPDAAVKEAKDRIPTAIRNSAFKFKREFAVTVNLAPADVKKEGPVYDLPIAVALLRACGNIRNECIEEYGLIGELALSGEVRKVRGILPMVMEMRRIGRRAVIVPYENREEASVVDGIDVIPVRTLREAADYLSGERAIDPVRTDIASLLAAEGGYADDDFADVKGQGAAVEAIRLAVAGGHNILMIGSPGAGKTMLARRIPSILPPLTVEEALEVARIHSVAGEAKGASSISMRRPFRAPHHTVSSIGLLGGGTHPQPGEVSLAHRGVLFLDEFAEFPRAALEVLRQPLEDGHVGVSRAAAAYDFPSRFMLVAAMNPCPCGYYKDETHECRCTMGQILKYQSRISGPVLDRIDMQIEVHSVPVKDLPSLPRGVPSAELREQVVRAREIQALRYRDMSGVRVNAEVKSRDLPRICGITAAMQGELMLAIERLGLSARAYDKVLRLARTIADLQGKKYISIEDFASAAGYRKTDQSSDGDCGGSVSFWAA